MQEVHGLKIVVSSVLIRSPLSALPVIVEVQHRSDGVYTQPVDMHFLKPIHGIGNQEGMDFRLAEVEYPCSPRLVLHLEGI